MAERLTKKKQKGLIAQRLLDPATTTSQLISLTKLYDRKKKARPRKDKVPVADESSMIFGRPRSYFSELDLQIFEIERERAAAAPETAATPVTYAERVIHERECWARLLRDKTATPERDGPRKTPERSLAELKELQRQAAIAPGDTEKVTYPDVVPSHLRADIN